MPGRVIGTVGVGARIVRNVTLAEEDAVADAAERVFVIGVMKTRFEREAAVVEMTRFEREEDMVEMLQDREARPVELDGMGLWKWEA